MSETTDADAFERPFRPVELSEATLTSFPLRRMAEQLQEESPFVDHGRNGLTLVRDSKLTVVLTVGAAGKVLDEHRSQGPTSIILLDGDITVIAAGKNAEVHLEAGEATVLSSGVEHRVKINLDSTFLLVIGDQQAS